MNGVQESFLVFYRNSKLKNVVVYLLGAVLGILVELSFCRVEALVFEQVSYPHSCLLAGLRVDGHGQECDLLLCPTLISHAPRVLEAMSRRQDPHHCW